MSNLKTNRTLNRIVTTNETWIHFYDPEVKQQSMEWKHFGPPRPKKFQKFARKLLASVFWDSHPVFLIHYLDKRKIITGRYYSELLDEVREKIVKNWHGMVSKQVLFLQDNASGYKSQFAINKFSDLEFELVKCPFCSPNSFSETEKKFEMSQLFFQQRCRGSSYSWFANQENIFLKAPQDRFESFIKSN